MIESDPDEADLLARARREFSPTAADAARVRRAIGAALRAGSEDLGTGASTTHRGPSRAPPSGTGGAFRLLVAGAIAVAGLGAGYRAGHRAGLREASIAQPAPEPSAAGPTDRSAAPPSPVIATGPPRTPRLDAPAIGSPVRSGHLPLSLRQRTLPEQSPPPSAAESLEMEVRALRNIERALRDGNPGLALAFLQELDRAVPHGQLTEERTATSALARCARGNVPFGVNLAEDFANQYPSSVYRERVEQACAPTDPARSGDSSGRRLER